MKYKIIKKYCDFIHEYSDKLTRYYNFKLYDCAYMDINEIPIIKQNGLHYDMEEQSDMFNQFCENYYDLWEMHCKELGVVETWSRVGRTPNHYVNGEVAESMYKGELDLFNLFMEITGYWEEDLMGGRLEPYEEHDAMYLIEKWIDNTKVLIDLYISIPCNAYMFAIFHYSQHVRLYVEIGERTKFSIIFCVLQQKTKTQKTAVALAVTSP